jgi:hypothetical protein
MSIVLGIDDGHDSIKCVGDKSFILPSKVISGKRSMIDTMTGEQKSGFCRKYYKKVEVSILLTQLCCNCIKLFIFSHILRIFKLAFSNHID